ncbi:MAG TPA: response regulator [Anaerolineales bacterium]|nr:response regulator [Anaerolineales bacterium]
MPRPVILLIDDEIGYARVVQEALQPLGLDVLIATNATEALLLYQQVNPSMILLDVMMPEIDGLTLLRWLREHSDQTRIPIHVVSAKSTPADQKAALKAGADGFLAKPFTFDELRQVILAHLPLPPQGSPDQTAQGN